MAQKQLALELRDRGIETVLENEGAAWDAKAYAVFTALDLPEFTCEDFRHACEEAGVIPHSPNVWGATWNKWLRKGLFHPNGQWRQPCDPKSHARPTRVYTKHPGSSPGQAIAR